MPWNPERYNQFKAERSAPFEDLLQLIKIQPGLKVIDLGCGTGELTNRLAGHLPGSQVLGIDSSPDMLAKAQAFKGPNLDFQLKDIQEIEGAWDLIFSNAAIQWIGDHASSGAAPVFPPEAGRTADCPTAFQPSPSCPPHDR